MSRTKKDWHKENQIIKEWVETCPTKFTCNDIYEDLKSTLVTPDISENQAKKLVQQQVGRLVMSGKVDILSKGRGRTLAVYFYKQNYNTAVTNKNSIETPITTTVQEPKQQEPVVSEHEMGRAIYDYIMHLREQVKNLNNDVKAYKHELKLAREDIGNQLKNKDKVIANLNDKIIELNRLVNSKPGSARTFSLGEMARVTSFKK